MPRRLLSILFRNIIVFARSSLSISRQSPCCVFVRPAIAPAAMLPYVLLSNRLNRSVVGEFQQIQCGSQQLRPPMVEQSGGLISPRCKGFILEEAAPVRRARSAYSDRPISDRPERSRRRGRIACSGEIRSVRYTGWRRE